MTARPKHTPGPWTVAASRAIFGGGGIPEEIATVRPTRPTSDEAEANARLIAAAPELLAALQNLHAALDKRLPDGRSVNQAMPREVFDAFYQPAIRARAAIAKAIGEEVQP